MRDCETITQVLVSDVDAVPHPSSRATHSRRQSDLPTSSRAQEGSSFCFPSHSLISSPDSKLFWTPHLAVSAPKHQRRRSFKPLPQRECSEIRRSRGRREVINQRHGLIESDCRGENSCARYWPLVCATSK